MRYTMKSLRKEVWRILNEEVTTIRIKKRVDGSVAESSWDDDTIEIFVDSFQVRVDHAVIHEIIHKILDKNFQVFATYHIYELWVEALEAPFFKRMSRKEYAKWRKVIDSKTVITRE